VDVAADPEVSGRDPQSENEGLTSVRPASRVGQNVEASRQARKRHAPGRELQLPLQRIPHPL